ncbi:hypothetical protein ACFLQ2_01475 [archaeon]
MPKERFFKRDWTAGSFSKVGHTEYNERKSHRVLITPDPSFYPQKDPDKLAKEFLKDMRKEHKILTEEIGLECAPLPERIPQKKVDKHEDMKGRPWFHREGYNSLTKEDYIKDGKPNEAVLDAFADIFKKAADKHYSLDAFVGNFGLHPETGNIVIRDLLSMVWSDSTATVTNPSHPGHEEEVARVLTAENTERFLDSLIKHQLVNLEEHKKIADYFLAKHGINT